MMSSRSINIKDAISIFEAVKYVSQDWKLPLCIQNKTTQEKVAVDLVEFGKMIQHAFEFNTPTKLEESLNDLVGPYIINATSEDEAAYYRCYMYNIFIKAAALVSRYKNKDIAMKDHAYISFKQDYDEAYKKTMEYHDVCYECSRSDK